LAILVVVSHSAVSSGHSFSFSFGIIGYRDLAVFGFFAISGFLITPGLIRDGISKYLIRRSVRIFPGYWVASVFTLLVFGTIWGRWAHRQIGFFGSLNYLFHNVVFIPSSPRSPSAGWNLLQGLPEDIPSAHSVNASIWSLPLEYSCYVALAALSIISLKLLRKSFEVTLFTLLVILWVTSVVLATRIPNFWDAHPSTFITFGGKWPYCLGFLFGAACALKVGYLKREMVWLLIPGLFAISYFAAQSTLGWAIIGSLTFTLAMILIGNSNLLSLNFIRTDISYGIYLYHWPVQQTLIHFLPLKSDLLLFIALSILISGALAYLSARLIEEPSMQWGKKFSENLKSA
jgi:peptidoglycan/LPS O-acetylase OafA/YrhL